MAKWLTANWNAYSVYTVGSLMVTPIGTTRPTSIKLQISHNDEEATDARVFIMTPAQAVQVPVDEEIQAMYAAVFINKEHPDEVEGIAAKWLEKWAHANGFNVYHSKNPF